MLAVPQTARYIHSLQDTSKAIFFDRDAYGHPSNPNFHSAFATQNEGSLQQKIALQYLNKMTSEEKMHLPFFEEACADYTRSIIAAISDVMRKENTDARTKGKLFQHLIVFSQTEQLPATTKEDLLKELWSLNNDNIFVGLDLHGLNLGCLDLSGLNLSKGNMADANVSGSNLSNTNLIDTNFTDANMGDVVLISADMVNANLAGANLIRADLSYADMTSACMKNADLSYADFDHTCLSRAVYAGATLTGVRNMNLFNQLFQLRPMSTVLQTNLLFQLGKIALPAVVAAAGLYTAYSCYTYDEKQAFLNEIDPFSRPPKEELMSVFPEWFSSRGTLTLNWLPVRSMKSETYRLFLSKLFDPDIIWNGVQSVPEWITTFNVSKHEFELISVSPYFSRNGKLVNLTLIEELRLYGETVLGKLARGPSFIENFWPYTECSGR